MIHTRTKGRLLYRWDAVHQDGREYDVFKAVSTSSRQGHSWPGFEDEVAIFAREHRQMFVRVTCTRGTCGGPLHRFRFSFLFRQVDRKSHGTP